MPRNTFNEQFERALQSKLNLQKNQANLYGQQAQYVGQDSDSLRALREAEAGLERQKAELLPADTQSQIALRSAQARGQNITGNLAIGEFQRESLDPTFIGQNPAFSDFTSGGGFSIASDPGASDPGDSYVGGIRRGIGAYDEPSYTNILGATFATGGMVGNPSPLAAEYELYRKAAHNAGIPALPMEQALKRIAAFRDSAKRKVQQAIAAGGTQPTASFARGGAVDVDGALLDGPGGPESDSIPAMIDGSQPAAVSKGEFHIPEHVVDYYGVKFFDGLLEKAKQAMSRGKKNFAKGGVVEGVPGYPYKIEGEARAAGSITPKLPIVADPSLIDRFSYALRGQPNITRGLALKAMGTTPEEYKRAKNYFAHVGRDFPARSGLEKGAEFLGEAISQFDPVGVLVAAGTKTPYSAAVGGGVYEAANTMLDNMLSGEPIAYRTAAEQAAAGGTGAGIGDYLAGAVGTGVRGVIPEVLGRILLGHLTGESIEAEAGTLLDGG
jgi:hypothetical protein